MEKWKYSIVFEPSAFAADAFEADGVYASYAEAEDAAQKDLLSIDPSVFFDAFETVAEQLDSYEVELFERYGEGPYAPFYEVSEEGELFFDLEGFVRYYNKSYYAEVYRIEPECDDEPEEVYVEMVKYIDHHTVEIDGKRYAVDCL